MSTNVQNENSANYFFTIFESFKLIFFSPIIIILSIYNFFSDNRGLNFMQFSYLQELYLKKAFQIKRISKYFPFFRFSLYSFPFPRYLSSIN